eukprot:1793046-Rhodomonas_salina.2
MTMTMKLTLAWRGAVRGDRRAGEVRWCRHAGERARLWSERKKRTRGKSMRLWSGRQRVCVGWRVRVEGEEERKGGWERGEEEAACVRMRVW